MPRAMWIEPDIVDMTAASNMLDRKGTRPATDINAVILHQIADDRGSEPMQYKNTRAHFVVTKTGIIIQLHPVETMLWASNAFNKVGVAVEFAGHFATEKGVWWKGNKAHNIPTNVQIEAGRELVLFLYMKHGIKNVYAHRQGYLPEGGYQSGAVNQRSNCPGPDIWYGVGEWAKSNLSLGDGGKGYKLGNGTAIPDSWRTQRVPTF
ncbi:MAG: N-acetylmuramoyl-L-alanine amidase [Alphaproteobacteria bacterium]|nr:N-acetylmuramoyl-L-alanine amidase [Alphaproteobacteria bacterium]